MAIVVAVVVAATIVVRRVTSRGIARRVARKIECNATDAVALVIFPAIALKVVMAPCATSARVSDILRINALHNIF